MKNKIFFFVPLSALFLAGFFYLSIQVSPGVYFLNVGQGDSTLIQAPLGQRILIDGGPDQKVAEELADVLPLGANTIDMAILSHFHEDHFTGLSAVSKHYRINRLVYAENSLINDGKREWLEHLSQTGTELIPLSGIQKLNLSENCDLELVSPTEVGKDGNSSLITRLACLDKNWVFLGDAPIADQEAVSKIVPDWRADTVKISHHGSDDGLNESWISQLGVKTAVIEVGADNKFGHPSLRVLKKISRLGVSVLRTDLDGRIVQEF